MTDNYIETARDGTVTFAGEGAVRVHQASVLKTAITLLERGIKPNRSYTWTNVLAASGRLTNKKYKRKDSAQAKADLEAWIAEQMKSVKVISDA